MARYIISYFATILYLEVSFYFCNLTFKTAGREIYNYVYLITITYNFSLDKPKYYSKKQNVLVCKLIEVK